MLLVSLEGVPSQASNEVFYRLQRKLAAVPGLGFETPRPESDGGEGDAHARDYARIMYFFEAAQACSPHCRVALVDKPFYSFTCHSMQVMETARALNEALLPPVDMHIMFVLQPDPNDAFSDFLSSNAWPGATLKDVHVAQVACLRTAKLPRGHPWPCMSYIVPLPPFCADNPPLLDDTVNDLVGIVMTRQSDLAS